MKRLLKKKEIYEEYKDLFYGSNIARWRKNIVDLALEDREFEELIFFVGVSALIGYAKNR